ncbi:MAG TPA: hypothetical protein VIX17_07120 [Pyrinomonadaceae bacterium]|jgi:hypothetical protein
MARAHLFICLSLSCLPAFIRTQAPAPVAEPQFYNSFYALAPNGNFAELDHQKVTTFHAKAKPLPGSASVKVSAEFKPAHAQTRLPGNVQFVVKGRSAIDPSTLYELRSLKIKKDHREILMTQAHGTLIGGSATSKLDEGVLLIRFTEYGDNSYRITPDKPLPAGEYALTLHGNVMDLFCFGVD